MITHYVEEEFTYKGYKCVVVMQHMGHRCGYVGIPCTHELYERWQEHDYGAIYQIDCHGGITYTEGGEDSSYPVKSDLLWFGFDCAHFNDGRDFELAKKYFANDHDALRQVMLYEKSFREEQRPARSLDFCVAECKSIVDQIEDAGYHIDNDISPEDGFSLSDLLMSGVEALRLIKVE